MISKKDLQGVPKLGTVVPKLGTEEVMNKASHGKKSINKENNLGKNGSILEALFGKTRRSILSLLFSHADESFYLRKILRLTGLQPGAGQRELNRLSQAGLILRVLKDQQVYFQANSECPIYGELKSMITKTAGLIDVLASSLAPISQSIQIAVVFGSFAGGRDKKESDVDLLIVGDVGFSDVVEKLSVAQGILGREINPVVQSVDEFRRRINKKDHFLTSVLKGELMFISGDNNDLSRLAEKRMAH
jgi:predicted nucleotidyltransferase